MNKCGSGKSLRLQRIYLKMLFALPGFLFWVKSAAQLNESDTAQMQFRAGISGAWQQGNVEILTLRSRLEVVTNGLKPLVFKSQNNSLYQSFGNKKADNDISSRNYLYYKPQATVYPFAMVYLQTNYRRQICIRWFGGGGGTWQFVRNAKNNMKLSGSLVYEETVFRRDLFNEVAYNGNNQITLWRATAYLAGWHQLFQQRLRLYYSTFWQPGLSKTHNFRSQIDAGLDFPLWKGLNATIVYALSHEEVVPVSVKQNDRILTFGLSYLFRK